MTWYTCVVTALCCRFFINYFLFAQCTLFFCENINRLECWIITNISNETIQEDVFLWRLQLSNCMVKSNNKVMRQKYKYHAFYKAFLDGITYRPKWDLIGILINLSLSPRSSNWFYYPQSAKFHKVIIKV